MIMSCYKTQNSSVFIVIRVVFSNSSARTIYIIAYLLLRWGRESGYIMLCYNRLSLEGASTNSDRVRRLDCVRVWHVFTRIRFGMLLSSDGIRLHMCAPLLLLCSASCRVQLQVAASYSTGRKGDRSAEHDGSLLSLAGRLRHGVAPTRQALARLRAECVHA